MNVSKKYAYPNRQCKPNNAKYESTKVLVHFIGPVPDSDRTMGFDFAICLSPQDWEGSLRSSVLLRRARAQPSFVTWRARPTASAPAGTSFVMHDPAPI